MSEKVIIAENLTRKFGDFVAVNAVSFEVSKGEIFGFLGANGAGKTTAMRMLCGLLEPTSGKASVSGFDIATQTEKVKQHIGYMSQKFSMYEDLTVKENFLFYGGVYGLKCKVIMERLDMMLGLMQLRDEMNSLVGSLPLGWKQKLSFSLATLHQPSIIFLDEPTGGVDPITRRQFWDMIYEAAHDGVTIFVTTHYMDEAEYCDRVSIMVDGVIEALDSPENLRKSFNAESMDAVFQELARGTSTK
ncbi:MAG: ATP-binding cassette domain-containing protein [Flavobacteriales bacterium]|nr:ATP-binding cassette domain-containing protein [Flavobacteriales bacterium]